MTKKDEAPDRGPGASSGHEEEAHERIVPGQESAAEGYEGNEGGGTRTGDPLAGIKEEPEDS